MTNKYLIIGMGVAGVSAAEAIRSQDMLGEITMVSRDNNGYYSLPGLAYFLANEVPDWQLSPYTEADFQHLRVRRVNRSVARLEPENHLVVTADGDRLTYDRLLLATGSQAVRPEIPGINLKGVVFLDSLEDARTMAELSRREKKAVVVGGGITAIEIVEGLVEQRMKVHYFLRGGRYWSNVLNEAESEIIENRLKKSGVKLHYNTELVEIIGKKGEVKGVMTRSGEQIDCGMAAIAVGVLPRKELAVAAGIKTDRGILVDETMHTNQPDILAAGDIAQVYDPHTKRSTLDTLWWVAREQGRVAGLNMTGNKTPYQKIVSSNMTRLAGLVIQIIGSVGEGKDKDMIGLARGDSDAWRSRNGSLTVQSGDHANHIRLQLAENRISGAIIIGNQAISRVLRDLITESVDISTIEPKLTEKPDRMVELLTEFHSFWRGPHEFKQPGA